ncbi:sigma-70 family RNA polymerase sigma factor [Spirillospora sp. NPDC047279]|uniref:RNA polymerase sigma factor n=1 Tax=Spirillospora sp. NPDC047279 TaxID=3155478 RepID=UPI0033F2AAAA
MGRPRHLEPDPGPALLDLYDAALPEVYGYLLSRCGLRTLAEDLTAETFLAAVEAVRKEAPPELSTAWLVGVARHKLADHWRRADREQRMLRAIDGGGPDTDDPWDERLDALLAREVLQELGPHHRAVLTLRYLDGLPVPQVAEHLDRTVRATEALLVRAKAAFRQEYDRRCPTPRPPHTPPSPSPHALPPIHDQRPPPETTPPSTTPPGTTRPDTAPPDPAPSDPAPPDAAPPDTAPPDTAPPDAESPGTAAPPGACADAAPGQPPPDPPERAASSGQGQEAPGDAIDPRKEGPR